MEDTKIKDNNLKDNSYSAEDMAVMKAGTPASNSVDVIYQDDENYTALVPEPEEPEFDPRNSGIDPATLDKGTIYNYMVPMLGLNGVWKNTREGHVGMTRINSVQRQLNGSRFHESSDYLTSGEFQKEILENQICGNMKTGFPSLDAVVRLNPSLIALGAPSSIGKTTIMDQVADNIAGQGVPVLYFSLEQTAFELITKSLSRTSYELSKTMNNVITPRSAYEIRNGAMSDFELQTTIDAYTAKVKDNMHIIECNFSMSVEAIENTICDFIVKNPGAPSPVVVIDYLQILAPSYQEDGKLLSETRAKVDDAIHSLKAFQLKNKLTIFVICSFNRESYRKPVDFESFKESGGIEYTADTVLGLQLAVLTSQDFYYKYSDNGKGTSKPTNTTEEEKRVAIQTAKAQAVRDMQVVVLKNRNGRTGDQIDLKYEPMFDTFYEDLVIPTSGDDTDDEEED